MDEGRYDHLHGDEGLIDLAPYMHSALEDVIDTILLYGQYPVPRKISGRRREFDLWDFVMDKVSHDDLVEYFTLSLGDYALTGPFAESRTRWERRIIEWLREELRDHPIVREKALEFAREDNEAA